MPSPLSGFRADSYKNIIVGPGAVVLNYGTVNERLLGATRGGNQFNPGITYRDIEADKAYGMVRGLRLIDDIQPQIVSNLLELSPENLKVAIPGLRTVAGTAGSAIVPAEVVGAGDNTETEFLLDQAAVNVGTLRVYVGGVLQVRGTDYDFFKVGAVGHPGGATDAIVFSAPPASSEVITASYSYASGTISDHEVLRIGEVIDSDYLENVAILGTALGYNEPFIGIIRNVLSNGGIEISLENKNEGVVEVTFTGMFTGQGLEDMVLGGADLEDVAPFEMRFPNTPAS